ncbi:hypothetical protein THICB2_590027 [Thiomonas sp. CB2]|nr:hypothetical protein THICB2_590027 [Thiomonas sp. CB2]CQR31499.1 hypothetical protein ACO3_250158 [Thiomonas arsenitoxydans]
MSRPLRSVLETMYSFFPNRRSVWVTGWLLRMTPQSRMLENFFCMTRGIFEYLDNGPQGSRLRRIAQ